MQCSQRCSHDKQPFQDKTFNINPLIKNHINNYILISTMIIRKIHTSKLLLFLFADLFADDF